MTRLNHAGTNTHKKDTVFRILGAEFSHCRIQPCLADGICSSQVYAEFGDEVQIGLSAGYGDHFFGLAFEDETGEEVKQVDVSNHVDFETF